MQKSAFCVALILGAVGSGLSSDLPKAPDGFAWHPFSAFGGSFLVPNGWHVLEESGKGTFAYFVTQEKFTPPGEYTTGTSINVILKNPSAQTQIEDRARKLAAQHGVELERGAFGPFKTLQCRYDVPGDADHQSIRVQLLAVANSKSPTAYLIMFESPISTWETAWAKGSIMLRSLALDADE